MKIQQRPVIIKGTRRETASAFYQLKIGHGYFKAYLHKRGHSSYNYCSCNSRTRETLEYLLLSCTRYKEERQDLKKKIGGLPFTMKVLLQTSIGIEAVLRFIDSTKISTRKWHLKRNEEEEEEGREGEGFD